MFIHRRNRKTHFLLLVSCAYTYCFAPTFRPSNGLAPDNLFFHGVACNCVQIQLSHLGFDTEFAQCEIQVDEKEWEGVRRKYWHGRDTYYLPIVTWKKGDI